MDYLTDLQNAALAAQAAGRLAQYALPAVAAWLGYKSLRLALKAAGRALAWLRPGPSELCRELLAALDGEALYDPADREHGTLCTDGCLVVFSSPPLIETAAGRYCHHRLSKRDFRLVLRKAYDRRDELRRREAARDLRLALGEVRRGRLGENDGFNSPPGRGLYEAREAREVSPGELRAVPGPFGRQADGAGGAE